MPILRQYSLPNCVLRLEGLSDAESSSGGAHPKLQVLTRLECNFEKEKQTLIGGRELLESLVQATNTCAQTIISGLPSSQNGAASKTGVQLNASQPGWFELKVPASLLSERADASLRDVVDPAFEGIQLRLSSVQIFDLMEALDQLLSDQQTLPDLQVPARSRSRKEVQSEHSTTQQTAPFAMGAISMVVAAAALYFVPVPQVPVPTEAETPSLTQPSSPSVSPAPTATPPEPPSQPSP
jgi:hypothetical protein